MSGPLLAIEGLEVRLGGRAIVTRASLALNRGEFVALIGPNGAGKTTLLKAAAGLLPTTRGHIAFAGEMPGARLDLRARARRCAYLEQSGQIHWPMRVRDVVTLGRLPFGAALQALSAADKVAIEEALTDCDLLPFADRDTADLSGGETARVLLARALAVKAEILLADEPVAALDPAHQIGTMNVLLREARKGGAVLTVMHDLALALRFADRVIVLNAGEIVADATPARIVADRILDRVFGLHFRASGEGRDLMLSAREMQ